MWSKKAGSGRTSWYMSEHYNILFYRNSMILISKWDQEHGEGTKCSPSRRTHIGTSGRLDHKPHWILQSIVGRTMLFWEKEATRVQPGRQHKDKFCIMHWMCMACPSATPALWCCIMDVIENIDVDKWIHRVFKNRCLYISSFWYQATFSGNVHSQ